jgi:16S rRNA (guanine1207-N2)-methyltransferase
MACGFKVLKKRGNLFIAADNKENGKRLQKWLEALDLHPLMHAGHKAKCASVCVNDQVNGDLLRDWYDAGAVKKNDNGLYAQAGLFSYETGDTASQLLIETINEPLFGSVADFGCGYGFLSVKAAEKNPALSSLHGFDADQRALDCYEMNLEETNKVAQSYWVDLGEDYRHSETFDFILMNPPFHAGRRELPTLGISFIRNASKNLKDRGVLWMVANTHLPYENILKEHFSDFKMITQQQGFKVIRAVK